MTDFAHIFGPGFKAEPPSKTDDIRDIETWLGRSLPSAYADFLRWANGGAGSVGVLYLDLWSAGRVQELNVLYSIRRRLGAEHLGVGSDGGDYCFLLRLVDSSLWAVPFGALAANEAKKLSDTFPDAMTQIQAGAITGDSL